MSGQLESFRIDNIDIGRRDGEYDTVGLCDVLGYEVPGLLLNIARLVAYGNLNGNVIRLVREGGEWRWGQDTAGRTSTLVRPGRSTNVRFRTFGE